MLLNLIKNSILVFFFGYIGVYAGKSVKKQLITSLVKYQKSEKYYMHWFLVSYSKIKLRKMF